MGWVGRMSRTFGTVRDAVGAYCPCRASAAVEHCENEEKVFVMTYRGFPTNVPQ